MSYSPKTLIFFSFFLFSFLKICTAQRLIPKKGNIKGNQTPNLTEITAQEVSSLVTSIRKINPKIVKNIRIKFFPRKKLPQLSNKEMKMVDQVIPKSYKNSKVKEREKKMEIKRKCWDVYHTLKYSLIISNKRKGGCKKKVVEIERFMRDFEGIMVYLQPFDYRRCFELPMDQIFCLH